MLSKLIPVAVFATVLFSCKKEAVNTSNLQAVSSESSENGVAAQSKWFGVYADGYGGGVDTAADTEFIGNGIATLQSSPWSYYYSSVTLPVTGRNIICDSLKFEAMLKNPDNEAGSVYPYDVSLWIYGSRSTAHVQFLADLQQYTAMQVGNISLTNSANLVYKFQDFTDVSLVAKGKKLSVYINGVLKEQLSFAGLKIGKLQKISIGFKGGGSVDWVKLFNSYSGAQIMQEDFNGPGSNVIWY